MTHCKYCEEEIMWEQDDYEDKWIPVDPDNGERHNCQNKKGPWISEPFECNDCGESLYVSDEHRSKREQQGPCNG